jgi:hypothetical protein
MACRFSKDTAAFWGTAVLMGSAALVLLLARRELAECQQQQESLQAQSQVVLQRIEAKNAIVEDVIGGRTHLREAAARFAELNAPCPTYMSMLHQCYPGLSDQQALCRNVMSFVNSKLSPWPDRAAAVLARLEKEMPASTAD